MLRIFVVLTCILPAIAGAEMWRWQDTAGRIHYSNVAAHVPGYAEELRGQVGYLTAAPADLEAAPAPFSDEQLVRLRTERRLRRRLAEIEVFFAGVRTRQRLRLEALWPNSTILPDWVVADRWMSLKDEEAKLRAALAELERRPRS